VGWCTRILVELYISVYLRLRTSIDRSMLHFSRACPCHVSMHVMFFFVDAWSSWTLEKLPSKTSQLRRGFEIGSGISGIHVVCFSCAQLPLVLGVLSNTHTHAMFCSVEMRHSYFVARARVAREWGQGSPARAGCFVGSCRGSCLPWYGAAKFRN